MKLDRSKLIRAREMLGYGTEKVAEEAGVSKNSVLRAEREEDIRPLTARKIAGALELPVANLLKTSGGPDTQTTLPDPESCRQMGGKAFWKLAQSLDSEALQELRDNLLREAIKHPRLSKDWEEFAQLEFVVGLMLQVRGEKISREEAEKALATA